MADDPAWDEGLMRLGSPDHVHAVGAFALYYNDLELMLYRLLSMCSDMEKPIRDFVFFSLHNRGRVDLIKLVSSDDPDEAQPEAVAWALRCFEICSENRNLLLHGVTAGYDENTLTIAKHRDKDGEKGSLKLYRFSLQQIRDAAVSAARTSDYIIDLCAAMNLRGHQPLSLEMRTPLPDKPPLPNKLSPPPPREEKTRAQRRPQSSLGKPQSPQ